MITYNDKIKSEGRTVKPDNDARILFHKLDVGWWRNHFVSCGTTVGIYRHNEDISVTKDIDELEGYTGYHWVNNPYISAFQYAASTRNLQMKKWHNWKKEKPNKRKCPLPKDSTFLEYETPLILIYNLQDVLNLVKAGNAEHWHLAEECKTYAYDAGEQKKVIDEFPIKPSFEPPVVKMIIGGHSGSVSPKQVEHLNEVAIPNLQTQYPSADILVFPKLNISTTKEEGIVGTRMVTMAGLKTLGYLNNTLRNLYP